MEMEWILLLQIESVDDSWELFAISGIQSSPARDGR